MDLILWRHAEAEPGDPDDERPLTAKGHKQAAKIAGWLDRNLPDRCKILVSPTKRTLQTAQALGRKFKVEPGLMPDATPETILALAKWPDAREPVLIVGHQPTLGQVAGLLIAGSIQDWTIKKSNAWWITQKENEEGSSNRVRAVITPDLITQ
ncbi:MAG: histidine phosphatase family protein [Burkholderiales bacterium RIFCSPLOWO2_02_FULL_57_36]|nr:MAG: histidine phosphatase family protein [Burkholderiales bacterium RIFCSPLOWO2_02_FULL_57_36]